MIVFLEAKQLNSLILWSRFSLKCYSQHTKPELQNAITAAIGALWVGGYFAASSGNITDKVIEEYIKNQDLEPEDEDFEIHDKTKSASANSIFNHKILFDKSFSPLEKNR